MKRQFISIIVFAVICLSVINSCKKSKSDNQNLSDGAEKFLELKTRINAMNAGSGQMSNFLSVIGNSEIRNGEIGISGTNVDSIYLDSIKVNPGEYWEYVTCATVTEYDNPDGTHTTTYDYGDGCDEYGALYKGKITYIWRNDSNYYYSKVVYEDYYSFGVKMNGMSEYSFTSDGYSTFSTGGKEGRTDSTVTVVSPVVFNWSGLSSGHEDIKMEIDDGTSYSYLSDYSNKWDSVSYTVLEGDYYCKNESADYVSEYNYSVTKPLVTDYTCIDTWVPVSGIETVSNKENGNTSSYSIDYGNGSCDNLAVLTENGKSSIVDFSQIFFEKVDSSGTTSPGAQGRQGKK